MSASINAILSIRDQIGATLKPVYLVTRTWFLDNTYQAYSSQIGEGVARDTETQLLPSPQIVDLSQSINLREGGAVKQGDIILKMISKDTYGEADLDGTTPFKYVERLYRVGAKLYQVISVTDQYVTFNVQLRELSNQQRYL